MAQGVLRPEEVFAGADLVERIECELIVLERDTLEDRKSVV